MMGSLGPPLRSLIRIAAVLLFAAIAVGALHLARWALSGTSLPGTRAAWTALLVGFLGYAMTVVLSVAVWKIIPLQYFLVAAWAWPLFVCMAVHCV